MLTIVTGPACSGKSTYVREHAAPGDVVIDFDVLAQALGSQVSHGHDAAVVHVTRAARSAAIRAAIDCHRQGAAVWVVECAPPRQARKLFHIAGARFVELTVNPGELHRRADEAGRPESWHALIDRWLLSRAEVA